MKYIFLILAALLLGYGSLEAKTYQIPAELVTEVKQNEQVYKQSPRSADAIFDLAMSYAYTGQIEKGWELLKSIPKYDANYAPKVIQKYEPLTKSYPAEWRYHFKLAFGYHFAGNKDAAVRSFEKVLEIDPKHIWAMGFLGLVEGERGNTDKGMEWSKKALAIEPNATAIHFLIAEGYRRKGDYVKAFGHLLMVGRLKSEEALSSKKNEKTTP
jgi:tetratricopeptide (TPR) repeat protein